MLPERGLRCRGAEPEGPTALVDGALALSNHSHSPIPATATLAWHGPSAAGRSMNSKERAKGQASGHKALPSWPGLKGGCQGPEVLRSLAVLPARHGWHWGDGGGLRGWRWKTEVPRAPGSCWLSASVDAHQGKEENLAARSRGQAGPSGGERWGQLTCRPESSLFFPGDTLALAGAWQLCSCALSPSLDSPESRTLPPPLTPTGGLASGGDRALPSSGSPGKACAGPSSPPWRQN